jgi:D-3-phosphoglycerate dehydrogenase
VRRYVSAFQHPANAHWDRDRCRGEEIAGMRVGLIGLGRVGRRVATYLDALGAEIHYTDPAASVFPRNYVRHASALELVKACRAVLLLASHTRNTPPILGRREIDALAGRYLVNTARGELVDEIALLEAIEGGRLAGCAVDVIADETGLSRRSRWLDATTAANVIVTPHIGGATVTSMHLTEEFVVEKLASRLSGGASR